MSRETEDIVSHIEEFNKNKVKLIGFISFLMGLAQSLVIYIISSYFKLVSGTENVGIFYFIGYAFALWALLNLHKPIKKLGKSAVFYLSLFLKIVAIAFIMLLPPGYWTIFFLIFYLILGTLEWVSMDVILESFSADRMSGRIRGKHLTFVNAGFLIGPLISTYVVQKYDFSGTFMLIFVINSFILALSMLGLRKVNHNFAGEIKIKELLLKVKERKNILRIYYISFVLELFYALMIIYTPIYLHDLGLSWEKIGLILSIMLIPFVLVQYPMGLIADKRLGEKEMIIASLALMVITTAIVYLVELTSVMVWAIVLFNTRIGAAVVEVLRDSYFYKRIDARDVDLINFFRTAMPLGYILATFFSTLLLIVFPVKAIFIFIAVVVVSALYPATQLIDNKCEKELGRDEALA
jgi:MFS family permease